MPKYSVDESDIAEGYELPPFYPARVFDANGQEVTDVIRLDTDTGDCEVCVADANGVLQWSEGAVLRRWERHPAPLRLDECGEMVTE